MSLGSSVTSVDLPCGNFIAFKEGFKFSRKAGIKEMTGRVITQLGSKKVRNNPNLFTQLLMQECLPTICGRPARIDSYDDLLVVDQDYLVLKIRQISKGDIVHGQMNCDNCSEKLEAEINLEDLPITNLPDPTEEESLLGFRVFVYEDDKNKIKAKFRYPKISDSNRVAQIAQDNPVTAHNTIMEMCLQEISIGEEEAKAPFQKGFLENLPILKYESLRNGFLDLQPGVEMKVKISCASCGHENDMEVSASDFLISAPKK